MQLLFLTSLVVAGYISFDLLAFSFEISMLIVTEN